MTRLLACGDLKDMELSGKGGLDPIASGTSLLASDVLWSDPTHMPGMRANNVRGSGVLFGPDVTEDFLKRNGLKLIIRCALRLVSTVAPEVKAYTSGDTRGSSQES